eukprot:3990909-Pyramimonas_sp.AAC.1
MGGKTSHIGRPPAILVEKNAELPEGHRNRKVKGRIVFGGSDVIDQDQNAALFQVLSSCPASMQASMAADARGLFPGHDLRWADVRQAHAESLFGRAPAWVRLDYLGRRGPRVGQAYVTQRALCDK